MICKIYGGIPPNNKPCTIYGITLSNIKGNVTSVVGVTHAEVFITIPAKRTKSEFTTLLFHSRPKKIELCAFITKVL